MKHKGKDWTIIVKKLVYMVLVMLMIAIGQTMVCADKYEAITKNAKITSSIQALESINRYDVISILKGNNTTRKPIRVMFRELEVYGLANCEAVTMKTQTGALVIYINKKHQNAPVEAIACLIAHESKHHTQTGTKQEEISAWVKETSTWNAFVRKNPTIVQSNSPLVKRENYLNKAYLADSQGSKGIEKVVSGIAMYKSLN